MSAGVAWNEERRLWVWDTPQPAAIRRAEQTDAAHRLADLKLRTRLREGEAMACRARTGCNERATDVRHNVPLCPRHLAEREG